MESRTLFSAATFATPLSLPVPGAQAPLVASDFNGPGNPIDLAVATPSTVQILTGHSDGSFTLGSSIPLFSGSPAQTPFQYGDFTGSGRQDIVLDAHDAVIYKTNDGTGMFTTGGISTIMDEGAGFSPLSGVAGNLNADHAEDLAIVGKPDSGNQLVLAILTSTGDGSFVESADYPITGSNAGGTLTNEQVLIDTNGEIIVYDGSGGNLDVFKGPGNATFTQLTPVPLTASLLATANIGGAGDLVVANGTAISVLVSQSDGTFQADSQGSITLGGPISGLTTGDFNLDGTPDVITNQGILFGNGDGTFSTTPQSLPASISGGNNFTDTLQAADILGNGKPDFVGFAAAGGAIVSAVNQTPAPASIAVTSNNNPANPGSDVKITATVSSAYAPVTATPTGSVTFFDGSTSLGSAPLVNGAATIDGGSSLAVGPHSITVQYTGDPVYAAKISAPLNQVVLSVSPATLTTLSSSNNPSIVGDDVVFTAIVSGNGGAGATPTGSVEFFDNGNALSTVSLNAGTATFDTLGDLSPGSHAITAQYQGDSFFSQSTSSVLTQTVNQPALLPLIASSKAPTRIVAGSSQHGTVTVGIMNTTGGKLSAQTITLLAESQGSSGNAIQLASKVVKNGIAIKPGQTKSVTFSIKLPATLAAGGYTLRAQVISSVGAVSKSSNGPSLSVAAPFIQLAGVANTGTITPNPAKAGASVTLILALTNGGNITSGKAALNIGLSTDGQTESTMLSTQTATIRIKPLGAGVLRLHLKLPATVAAGSYKPFISITDDGDMTTILGQAFQVVA